MVVGRRGVLSYHTKIRGPNACAKPSAYFYQ